LVRQSWIRQTGRRRLFAGSGGSCHIRSAHVRAVHITRRRGDSLTREARGTSSQSRPTATANEIFEPVSQPASQPASQSGRQAGSCVSTTANISKPPRLSFVTFNLGRPESASCSARRSRDTQCVQPALPLAGLPIVQGLKPLVACCVVCPGD
jgi:hypothetical protein